MKKYWASAILVVLSFFLLTTKALALQIPVKPMNYVSDYANLLSLNTVQQLNNQLRQFEQQTSNQIVVAIFPSLEQENLEDFAVHLEEQWKIGQKDRDNGVLLIIFVKQHKIRIEVGYGLEGAVPDTLAYEIINNDITPYFKQGQYDQGVTQGVNALMRATQHEYKGQLNNQPHGSAGIPWFIIIIFVIAIIFRLLGFGGGSGGSNDDNSSGGGFSGGGGRSGGGGASGGW